MNCLIQLFFVMCILLILFVALKWVMGYAQYTPPQPAVVIAGIIAIMIFVGFVLNCTGVYRFHISG